ncbi:uncharacterized protein B0P05DRAFT_536272 [Gilbertella persicaria]|uniref:uncharacterized protein n=1 Tax=Gilbertella persicaria TaxID=101096 RepID=UPI00221FA770|nr:uncharacterized protein B0P05DRAFT_536272 [Gilbertella persicaria]KAI8084132.1 hypothetical protein B0P05DRAFT_536272 [Gilbertella persicaria]
MCYIFLQRVSRYFLRLKRYHFPPFRFFSLLLFLFSMFESLKSKSKRVFQVDETTRLLSSNLEPLVEDKYYLVYWIFFIYGIAMLLPWNGKQREAIDQDLIRLLSLYHRL